MPSEAHEGLVAMVQASPPGAGTVEESRAAFEAMMTLTPLPDDAHVEEVMIEHMNADWVSIAGSNPKRAVLYLHGGGYVIGNNVGYREFAARMARSLDAKVLVINYRLAPENPFPAAVDDAVMAYRWLLAQGISPQALQIAGDSAGGGLTLATLVALRDAGQTLPACATCFSPWVDLEGTGGSAEPGAVDDPMIDLAALQGMADHYAPTDKRNPLAAPLYADLSGLPPLLVFVGTREILLDDATRVVDNARSAGVDTTLHIGEGLIHVWQIFDMPESQQSLEQMAVFTGKHIQAA